MYMPMKNQSIFVCLATHTTINLTKVSDGKKSDKKNLATDPSTHLGD